eukprot:TRINITY_DN30896_c0_g1_i1.p1 TRINITY_DN30896_c0_g1~~TRINITY_DN30896_c0_g1_i1.p1  ORF type:complete len:113 (+),score=12.10 TRINITY_DN30896_c0_g1_i1:106-444(+)
MPAAKVKPTKQVKQGKNPKKKWSKGKIKDKANHAVTLNKATYDKLFKEIPAGRVITPHRVVDSLKVNASVARQALRELESKGLIKLVVAHGSQMIYTRVTLGVEEEGADGDK